jgi:hypothetical protein
MVARPGFLIAFALGCTLFLLQLEVGQFDYSVQLTTFAQGIYCIFL